MGVYIDGLFLDASEFPDKNGRINRAVSVAAGRDAYRVFLSDDDFDSWEMVSSMKPGDSIKIKARPYVSKNGSLSWGSASVVI